MERIPAFALITAGLYADAFCEALYRLPSPRSDEELQDVLELAFNRAFTVSQQRQYSPAFFGEEPSEHDLESHQTAITLAVQVFEDVQRDERVWERKGDMDDTRDVLGRLIYRKVKDWCDARGVSVQEAESMMNRIRIREYMTGSAVGSD